MNPNEACDFCGKLQPIARTASGQAICVLCWNDPGIEIKVENGGTAARRREPADTRAKRLPRTAHFITYSLASVQVDAGEVCLRFEYPGGYDQHRLSRKEAKQIAGELELALDILAKLDGKGATQ